MGSVAEAPLARRRVLAAPESPAQRLLAQDRGPEGVHRCLPPFPGMLSEPPGADPHAGVVWEGPGRAWPLPDSEGGGEETTGRQGRHGASPPTLRERRPRFQVASPLAWRRRTCRRCSPLATPSPTTRAPRTTRTKGRRARSRRPCWARRPASLRRRSGRAVGRGIRVPHSMQRAGVARVRRGPSIEGFAFRPELTPGITARQLSAMCSDDTALHIRTAVGGALAFADGLTRPRDGGPRIPAPGGAGRPRRRSARRYHRPEAAVPGVVSVGLHLVQRPSTRNASMAASGAVAAHVGRHRLPPADGRRQLMQVWFAVPNRLLVHTLASQLAFSSTRS